MGKVFAEISPDLKEWIARQHIFFVATAPLASDGLINCSPKGMDTFRILAADEVAYLDLTGSGIETIAHLRENSRIVFMFCEFSGPPKIVRLHGTGSTVLPEQDEFATLKELFPNYPGVRAIVRAKLHRIADSCGLAVPHYEFTGERDGLIRYAATQDPAKQQAYRNKKNALSLDGLPGLEPRE